MKLTTCLWFAAPVALAIAFKPMPGNKPGDGGKKRLFFDKAGMDTTVKPGDNFFLYANGGWIKKTEIPPALTGWGSFFVLNEQNTANLHHLLDSVSKFNNPEGSVSQKVADFYYSGMDTVSIEKLGYDPIKPQLAKINAVTNYKQLVQLAADGFKTGNGFLFGFSIGADDKQSTKNAVELHQTGLTLPNRDYYLKTDSNSVNIRKKYVAYIAKMLNLTGTPQAEAATQADEILALETAIAKSHRSPVELRDPIANYNKYSFAAFEKQMPDVDLKDAFMRIGVVPDSIIIGQPRYYHALDSLLKTQPIAVWKNKFKFNVINGSSSALSSVFGNANFEFFGRTLSGQKQQRERWKRITSNVNGNLGELLGQLYVAKYFTADAKQRMLALVNNLQAVYHDRIERLDWMSAETKKRAIDKLNAFTKKIGYPDKWENYNDVTISKTSYFANLQSVSKHHFAKMLARYGKPVDKTEWGMTPPTVNAYYNPAYNEIVFPAGILQFPFFDKDADDAINYGAIGAVIGHEMTHGFDDQGRQFDKDGNLTDWWTAADASKFTAKAQLVVNQYNGFSVFPDLNVNGKLTLGENLADLGGVNIAFEAFKRTQQGKTDEKIDGFTPEQRFFLAYAQVWRIKTRDQAMRNRILTDPHSPEMYRVNGPLANTPAFYKAFNIKPGDKLYRPDSVRVSIW